MTIVLAKVSTVRHACEEVPFLVNRKLVCWLVMSSLLLSLISVFVAVVMHCFCRRRCCCRCVVVVVIC